MLCLKRTHKNKYIIVHSDGWPASEKPKTKQWRRKKEKPERKRPENQFQIGQPIFSLKNSGDLRRTGDGWLEKFTLSISAVLWFSCFGTNNLSNQCRSCIFLPFSSPIAIHLALAHPSTYVLVFPYSLCVCSVWLYRREEKNGLLSAVHFQNE